MRTKRSVGRRRRCSIALSIRLLSRREQKPAFPTGPFSCVCCPAETTALDQVVRLYCAEPVIVPTAPRLAVLPATLRLRRVVQLGLAIEVVGMVAVGLTFSADRCLEVLWIPDPSPDWARGTSARMTLVRPVRSDSAGERRGEAAGEECSCGEGGEHEPGVGSASSDSSSSSRSSCNRCSDSPPSRPYSTPRSRPFVEKSRPMCGARARARARPATRHAPACGECGSPGRSESAWCLRWSVCHWVSGPCIAIEPRIAQSARSGALVSKLLCVKSRWKPTVIPRPQAT